MSHEVPSEENAWNTDSHGEFMKVFHLAQELEQYAQDYSPDYAEGIEDGCVALKEAIDIGGELTTTLGFKAERTREELVKGVYGEIICNEYTVFGSIKQDRLSFLSFPEHVQDYVREVGEYDDEFLYDDTTRCAIQYTLDHAVTSDGELMHTSSLVLHVAADQIIIPEHDVSQEFDDGTDSTEQIADKSLLAVLGPDTMADLSISYKNILDQHNDSNALGRFYEHICSVQFLTRTSRINLVRNITRQLFLLPVVE